MKNHTLKLFHEYRIVTCMYCLDFHGYSWKDLCKYLYIPFQGFIEGVAELVYLCSLS